MNHASFEGSFEVISHFVVLIIKIVDKSYSLRGKSCTCYHCLAIDCFAIGCFAEFQSDCPRNICSVKYLTNTMCTNTIKFRIRHSIGTSTELYIYYKQHNNNTTIRSWSLWIIGLAMGCCHCIRKILNSEYLLNSRFSFTIVYRLSID